MQFFFGVLAVLIPLSAVAQKAPPAREWQRLDNCQLIPNRYNDGDSFHVRATGKEWLFRLYFVDTPETEANYPERTSEQAVYFGITESEAVKCGEQAKNFTQAKLADGFTVFTRWHKARGRSKDQRYYAVVMVREESLADALVRAGLARIYGTRTPLPDGRDSRTYRSELAGIEAQAKAARMGAWAKAKQ